MQLKKWMKDEFWKKNAELQYKRFPKKIICESFLETDSGMSPDDYKIYCFNGEPKAILHISDRNSEKKGVFMSPKWEFISTVNNRHNRYEKPDKIPEKPKTLEQMLEIAKNLSKPFPFVRVDLYEVNNKVVFGELTFTPGSGIYTSETNIGGKTMENFLIFQVK